MDTMKLLLEICPKAASHKDAWGAGSTLSCSDKKRRCGKTPMSVLLEQSAKPTIMNDQHTVSSMFNDHEYCTEWIFSSSVFCTFEK